MNKDFGMKNDLRKEAAVSKWPIELSARNAEATLERYMTPRQLNLDPTHWNFDMYSVLVLKPTLHFARDKVLTQEHYVQCRQR